MKVVITGKGIEDLSLDVAAVSVNGSVDLKFQSSKESQESFQKLRAIGVKCYHAGENAPGGPFVSMYQSENKNLKFIMQ